MSLRVRGIIALLVIAGPAAACAQPSRATQGSVATVMPPATLISQPPQLLTMPAPSPAGIVRPEALPQPRVAATAADVERLRGDMRGALGATLLAEPPVQTAASLGAALAMMARQQVAVDGLQVVLVVDRSPAVQRMWLAVAGPGSALIPLGTVRVSTGKPGRKEHFRTPVGVFDNDGAILGYRALGTYNENHIRGVGVQGMRVWDFGWQTTDDWRWHDMTGTMAIRMEMHATDPAVLEPRLGRWDSEGCIRIPSRFNSWLDHSGLIDAKLSEAAPDDRRVAALLPRNVRPNPLAGHLLVVVDTSDPDATPSDHDRANTMAHSGAPPTPEHDDAS